MVSVVEECNYCSNNFSVSWSKHKYHFQSGYFFYSLLNAGCTLYYIILHYIISLLCSSNEFGSTKRKQQQQIQTSGSEEADIFTMAVHMHWLISAARIGGLSISLTLRPFLFCYSFQVFPGKKITEEKDKGANYNGKLLRMCRGLRTVLFSPTGLILYCSFLLIRNNYAAQKQGIGNRKPGRNKLTIGSTV